MNFKKNILILSTTDNLGAGSAALRITKALLRAGFNVQMVVKEKATTFDFVIQLVTKKTLWQTGLSYFKKKIKLISPLQLNETHLKYCFFNLNEENNYIKPGKILANISFKPDVIISTWVSNFVNSKTLSEIKKATGAKTFLLPMDMSPFTGGCHYAWECEGYKKDCKNCPAIINEKKKEYASKNLELKKENLKGIEIIVPSQELFDQTGSSVIFKNQKKIEKVLIPIDENIFNDSKRKNAKELLNISDSCKTILFGATVSSDQRKGYNFFKDSINILVSKNKNENILVLLVGNFSSGHEIGLNCNYKLLDYVKNEEMLSLIYQASDLMVCASVEDSGPMMINESIMCGTPVISFNIGVSEDLIIDNITGYRVKKYDVQEMASQINRFLNNQYNFNNKIALFGLAKTSFSSFPSKISLE